MKPGSIPFRKTVLWIIPPLILIICGAILGVFYYQIGKMRDTVLQRIVEDSSRQVETRFESFFAPMVSKLLVARNWGRTVNPDLTDARALNTQFIPQLQQLPNVAAILAGNGAGRSYALMRDGNGWRTRQTDTSGMTTWIHWESPTEETKRWREKLSYDPRERPWYRGAMDATDNDTPFWTEPYEFLIEGEKGITAAIRWHTPEQEDRATVIAFDVLLDEISKLTASLSAHDHGDVFIVTDDGRVIGPPQDELFGTETALHEAILTPIDSLGLKHLNRAFTVWTAKSDHSRRPFRYLSDGVYWWASFRPLTIDNRTFRLGITIPEYELVTSIGAYRNVVPAAVIFLGLVAFVGSILLVRKHGQQMDWLAGEARRLASADDDLLETSLDNPVQIRELIAKGESERLEFKSTVRWNLHTDKPGKEIELAWLKGVVGFLNTEGGIILIGIDDNGTPLGLEHDSFANADKCLRHIGNLISQHIGIEFAQFIRYSLVTIDERSVVVIQCAQSTTPAFLKAGKEEDFYVRAGPANQRIAPSQILKYLETRKAS